jgi:hypothetical protein
MKRALLWTLGIVGMVVFLFAADIQFGNQVKHEVRAAAGDTYQVDTFITDGSWLAPAGVTEVFVEAWGPGGIGVNTMGGGGGGCYAASTVSVTPGTYYSIDIGAAAISGYVSSTFATTTVIAGSGYRANGSASGCVASRSTGDIKFGGGDGGIGTGARLGGGAAGNSASGTANVGGDTNGGTSLDGAGTSPLYGIGGDVNGSVGRSGSNGHIRISYTSSVDPLYPTVATRSWGAETSNGTSHPISLPSGVQTGDLLVLVFGSDGATTSTINAGWTQLESLSQTTVVTQAIFYKTADGSDTPTVTTAASEAASYVVFRIQNGGTPVATSTRRSSTNANPGSLDTGSSAKYLWLGTGTWDMSIAFTVTVPPTGFNSFVIQPARMTGGAGVTVAVSQIFEEIQTKDPGNFTSVSEQWVAGTIAIPYLASAPPEAATGPTRRTRTWDLE